MSCIDPKTLNDIMKSETFKKEYDIYIQENNDLLKILLFLDTIKLNKDYYKLNIVHNIDELKTKNINGFLNKLTHINIDDIYSSIIEQIDKDNILLNITISIIIEKCILQKTYSQYYIDILKKINVKYNIDAQIYTIMKSYDIMFNENVTEDIIDDIYKKQYLLLCEKNKRLDNYIGYCETIYKFEKNKLILDKYDKMIIDIIINIQKSIVDEKTDDIYKYIICLHNIYYIEEKGCPENIKLELNNIKTNIKDKKILFKIMDIVEL